MLILWTLLIAATAAQKVFESTEDIGPEAFINVTTLYPISYNKTNNNDSSLTHTNIASNDKQHNEKAISDVTSNETNSKEDKAKVEATVWKIEAAFAESSLDKQKQENGTSSGEKTGKKNETKEFKPSTHLGSFIDEDSLQVTPTKASFGSFTPVKNPSSGFVSSARDEFRSSFTKIPKQMYQTHKQYPYKFDSPILTRVRDTWRHDRPDKELFRPERPDKDPWSLDRPDSLESKPTAEVPVKVPAGGLYKYEDPFKEKPGKHDDDFGLAFNEEGKDSAVKKRVNPWESFLRLVTAFLPVGLIISALTPSLITIESTGPSGPGGHGNNYPSNVFRRSDHEVSDLPVISEACRRRLLCELQSDKNYKASQISPHRRRGKHCYKLHCEDTEALARTLQWLLQYRQSTQNEHYT